MAWGDVAQPSAAPAGSNRPGEILWRGPALGDGEHGAHHPAHLFVEEALAGDAEGQQLVVAIHRTFPLSGQDAPAWVVVVDTPFYALSDSLGLAGMANVPAGNYRMRVWHSRLPVGAPATDQALVVGNGPSNVMVRLAGLAP